MKKPIENKGLKVNIGKTKIMKYGTNRGPVFASGKYPCGVCKKGVGRNSVYCSSANTGYTKDAAVFD